MVVRLFLHDNAKVHDLDAAIWLDHDVLWFDVTVNDVVTKKAEMPEQLRANSRTLRGIILHVCGCHLKVCTARYTINVVGPAVLASVDYETIAGD